MFPLCTGPGTLSFIPVAGIKYLDQSNLGERGFILVHGSRLQSITVGQSQWQKLTQVILYPQSQGRQQGTPVLCSSVLSVLPHSWAQKLTKPRQFSTEILSQVAPECIKLTTEVNQNPTQHITLSQSPLLLDGSH